MGKDEGIEIGSVVLTDGRKAVTEKVVSLRAAEVDKAFVCPKCGCDSVLVGGVFEREFTEEFHDGESPGPVIAPTVSKIIQTLHCPKCVTRYIFEPDSVYELREQIVQTHLMLAGNGIAGNEQVN